MDRATYSLEAAGTLRELYAQALGIPSATVSNETTFIGMGG